MSQKVTPRDVSGLVLKLREFLLGRKYTNALRFPPFVATRSPPLPDIPEGPHHKLADNYYYARDARREVQPPLVVVSQKLLESGHKAVAPKGVTPGNVYRWD